ncbi:hypothetical protein ELE36_15670 [Pseudolysobacter antarcticus]|uniref:DUF3805 domain-containing protein n=1 Tax=Pseudolysobacter antarcticus TaxID=2511995 RepID=A0A411HMF5_9GAMM|nr:hypothetical protein [Pseudolysobacter antarcticus]QBB71678.1 hypothetical protein ELE36_15670 [Pseudolysobacter antarcticus]
MATLLEHGGEVDLWCGWRVTLPPSYHERNSDGSWSFWGADWTIDAIIVEVAGDSSGKAVSAEKMLGSERTINASGGGWVGEVVALTETDNGRDVFRLSANLASENTSLSFWVSYFEEHQRPFAEKLVRGVVHGT